MFENFKRPTEKIGLPPGTLVYVGDKKVEHTHVSLVEYDENTLSIKDLDQIDEYLSIKDSPTIKWLNIRGIHDLEILKKVGEYFNIDLLTLEDILNPSQYPKIEFFDDYIFIILKTFTFEENDNSLKVQQISIILGANFVISLQDTEEDTLISLQERIINNVSFRKRSADYLAYILIDFVIDGLFETLKNVGERIEQLEDKLILNPDPDTLPLIYKIKRDIIFLRSIFRPLRDLILSLERIESPFIKSNMKVYLRDLYDHIIQLVETIEIYRETVSHILDIYLSSANNKMSEVMKVLTIIATIFIPLTFLAGIYGMNFKYMPELEWHYGYFALLGVMFLIFIAMIFFYKSKKWI